MKCGLLPLSQESALIGDVSYHRYSYHHGDYDDYDCGDYDYDDNIHLASSSSIPSLFPMVKEALGGENCQWLQNNQESKVRL